MSQFVEFMSNHPVLFAAFAGILVALVWSFAGEIGGAVKAVSGAEATRLINQEQALIVDVRDAGEFEQGHILDARNLPLTRFNERMSELDRHKDQPVLLVCAHGVQSRSAGGLLKKAGFTRLYTLRGGLGQWRADNLPLTRGRR